jgi:hypothetical protein
VTTSVSRVFLSTKLSVRLRPGPKIAEGFLGPAPRAACAEKWGLILGIVGRGDGAETGDWAGAGAEKRTRGSGQKWRQAFIQTDYRHYAKLKVDSERRTLAVLSKSIGANKGWNVGKYAEWLTENSDGCS